MGSSAISVLVALSILVALPENAGEMLGLEPVLSGIPLIAMRLP